MLRRLFELRDEFFHHRLDAVRTETLISAARATPGCVSMARITNPTAASRARLIFMEYTPAPIYLAKIDFGTTAGRTTEEPTPATPIRTALFIGGPSSPVARCRCGDATS